MLPHRFRSSVAGAPCGPGVVRERETYIVVLITQLTTGGAVTAKVTAMTPDDDCPGLTATTAHGKVVASRQEAALN
jgi:hypothetical protein